MQHAMITAAYDSIPILPRYKKNSQDHRSFRNKNKKIRLIKQVAIHGVYSDKCLVRDMEYSFMGNYRVGWYDEGIKYPYNMRPFYNDGIWYAVDFKYYNPWTNVINPQFALSLPQFRYSAVDIQNPPCIITYLRTYLKYPQTEYLVKAGLGKYVGSKMILKKIGSDKGFRKWLMVHREELRAHHYYVDVVLRGYRTGKPLEALQSYREAKINLRNNNTLAPIRELFKDTEREKFFDYISKQNTNANTYLDYLKACNYLGLDISSFSPQIVRRFLIQRNILNNSIMVSTIEELDYANLRRRFVEK